MTSVALLLENAYLADAVAGLLHMVMAYLLIRLGSRSRGSPERLLGVFFLLVGFSYAVTNVPLAMHLDTWVVPSTFVSRLFYAASVVCLAQFARRTFYDEDSLGQWLQWVSILLMAIGLSISAIQGDWTGYSPLYSVGFWFEWVGQLIPFAWLGLAGLVESGKVHRRVKMGLSHPLVRHRFVFLCVFGLAQICAFFIMAAMYIVYETQNLWSAKMDLIYATTEVTAVVIIGIAYFPPGFLRNHAWLSPMVVRDERG